MKSYVKLSVFSSALTIIVTGLLLSGCIVTYEDKRAFFILLAVIIILVLSGLLYAPVAVQVDDTCITIIHPLRRSRIPLSDVASVEWYRPVLGTIRICASGGFMGYWGKFRAPGTGFYTACYGKASDCFLLCTSSGAKYVLGCADPDRMIKFIKSRISSPTR